MYYKFFIFNKQNEKHMMPEVQQVAALVTALLISVPTGRVEAQGWYSLPII